MNRKNKFCDFIYFFTFEKIPQNLNSINKKISLSIEPNTYISFRH